MRFTSIICSLVLTTACPFSNGSVVTPANDEEIVEVLPAVSGGRAEERRLRQQLAANPKSAGAAVSLARRYLDQARTQGDPRYAGRALAVLQTWQPTETAPDEVLLTLATLQQFLHEFDASASQLELLVARNPGHAQAWLTLATVRRVQGRYADSDRACRGLSAIRTTRYSQACRAENDSLRGKHQAAGALIQSLLAEPQMSAATRNWLLTTLAEDEARAGRPVPAESAYRSALAAQPDAYTVLSYADFLLLRARPADALVQLRDQPRTDAVLLRRAIAGRQAHTAQAPRDIEELQARMTQAALRPEARTVHAREFAMFSLWIANKPHEALALARENVLHQREPLDLLLLAQAAAASGDASALREAAALRTTMGLHDKRLDALLD